jgi:hypothetical protein
MTPAESYRDMDKIFQAEQELFEELGGWDLRYGPIGLHNKMQQYPFGPLFWGTPRVMPGEEISETADVQNRECEIMKTDEYDRLNEIGWYEFWKSLIIRSYPDTDIEAAMSKDFMEKKIDRVKAWEKEHPGVEVLYAASVMDPVNMLSTWRTQSKFLMDIQNQYDKVKTAVHDVIMPEFVRRYQEEISQCSCHLVMVPAATFQMPFVSLDVFEELQGDWVTACTEAVLDLGRFRFIIWTRTGTRPSGGIRNSRPKNA